MVASADRDAFGIEGGGNVVRVDAVDDEGDDATAVVTARPEGADALEFVEAGERITGEGAVVIPNGVQTHALEVAECGCETDRLGDGGGARFEAHGDFGVGRPFDFDGVDHLSPTEEGRHRLEQVLADPHGANAGGAEHLVCTDGVRVDAERLHVDRHVGRRLGTVDEGEGAHFVGHARHVGNGVDDPEDVGHVADGEDAGAR